MLHTVNVFPQACIPLAVLATLLPVQSLSGAAGLPGDALPESQVATIQHKPLSAQEDHRRLLTLLGIAQLRPGADPNHPEAANAVNYDESKAHPFPTLPALLRFKDGGELRTASDWKRRRLELLEDFDREVYGRTPAALPKPVWEVLDTRQETVGGIAVHTRTVSGRVDNSAYPALKVAIELSVTLPAKAAGPVPVVVHLAFPRALTARFPTPPGPSWQEQVLARGWGYAELFPTSYQADSGAGLAEGIIGLSNLGQPRKPDDWGALRAWAWGASRAMDFLEQDPRVDTRSVAIEGLSRYGKAALVIMAYDERFALGFIGSSGAAGAKLHRRNFGENVENIASPAEYHWMAGNYLKYAGPLTWNDLPVDSHELIALCAPRPLFIGCGAPGVEGQWTDQRGMFEAAVAAGPAYLLLGARDLGSAEYPSVERPLLSGELAFSQHEGGHTNHPNWPRFMEFAGRYLGMAGKP